MLSLFPGSRAAIGTVLGDHPLDVWSPSARCAERTRKRRSQYLCRIDGSGHASIFFVLVYIFMACFLACQSSRIAVDLPRTEHPSWLPGGIREDAMNVGITRSGRVFFRTYLVLPDELTDHIRVSLRSGAENRIYVYADARAMYRDVKAALDAIRLAGVEHISFITESRRH